jgi:nitroreductase
LVVAVIGAPRESDKVPAREQVLSAGCVCLGLLNAALAAGWGANWLTGWPAYDRDLLAGDLGLQGAEWLAGFVHIGSSTALPPERPRPDVESITTWTGA